MRISTWSSDVCSSDLRIAEPSPLGIAIAAREQSSNRADAMERGTASLVKRAAKPGDDRAGRPAGARDRDLAILQNLIAGVPEALGVEQPTRRQPRRLRLAHPHLSRAGSHHPHPNRPPQPPP